MKKECKALCSYEQLTTKQYQGYAELYEDGKRLVRSRAGSPRKTKEEAINDAIKEAQILIARSPNKQNYIIKTKTQS